MRAQFELQYNNKKTEENNQQQPIQDKLFV